MNIAKLELDGSSYDCYYIEICRRLQSIIGKDVSYDLAIAIMHLLVEYHIKFKDGFEVNSSVQPLSDIWIADAAAIASAICTEIDEDYIWFKSSYNMHTNSDEDFESMLCLLIEQVRNAANVLSVELA